MKHRGDEKEEMLKKFRSSLGVNVYRLKRLKYAGGSRTMLQRLRSVSTKDVMQYPNFAYYVDLNNFAP